MYLDEAYTIRKHTLIKKTLESAVLYVAEIQSKKKVAEIVVPLPIDSSPPSIDYFTHDSEILEMVFHPVEDDVAVLDDGSFHLIKNDYKISFTEDVSADPIISSLRVIKVGEKVFYYAFLLKRIYPDNYL